MKITELKIDLLLYNDKKEENLIKKYKESDLDLVNKLIIFYLDDFLEIDTSFKNRLINIFNDFQESETFCSLFDDSEPMSNIDVYGNRKNLASLKYLEDLNEYVLTNELDIEKLSESYNSIIELDRIYDRNNNEKNNKQSVLDKFFDIKFKLYSFKLKGKIAEMIMKINDERYKQKIKK